MSWNKKKDILMSKQATGRMCNLTARNDEELADHVATLMDLTWLDKLFFTHRSDGHPTLHM